MAHRVGSLGARDEGLLLAGDDALALDVLPRHDRGTAVAAVRVGVEAEVLGGERHDGLASGGDAEAVRGGLGRAKRPAAAAHGLVADVANHLRALREALAGIVVRRDVGGGQTARVLGIGRDNHHTIHLRQLLDRQRQRPSQKQMHTRTHAHTNSTRTSGVGARAPMSEEEAPIGRSAKRFISALQVIPGVLLISSI